jgi:hypothetical protein
MKKKIIWLAVVVVVIIVSIVVLSNSVLTRYYAEQGELPLQAVAQTMPDDFDFKIDFGTYGKNNINTYNDTFTKDLVTAGSETIDFMISADKMRDIYKKFLEYRIYDLPDDINAEIEMIEGKTYSCVTPYREYSLTYTSEGKTRTIVYNEGEPWPVEDSPDTRDRLRNFVDIISDYIYSTEEYEKMSPAEGGYQ